MNRWTRVLFAVSLLTLSLIAISACSLRYDFDTECTENSDCARLQTTQQSDPVNNELYECQNDQCVPVAGECRADEDCTGDNQCVSNECMPMQPDTDADSGDGGDDGGDAEEVIDNTCEDDTDCDDGFACDPGGMCAEVACSDDTYCTDTFGDSFACGATGECADTNCTSTTYCNTNFGVNVYCAPSGTCMDTAREGCENLFYPEDLSREKVMILGSIVPTGPAFESLGTTIVNGVEMALVEYADNAGSLLDNTTVAHLQCSPGANVSARELAQHMQSLGVTSIVGPLTSDNYLDVVRNVSGDPDDNPMVTIAPGATSPAIENLSSAGTYSFQLIANDKFQSSAIVDFTKLLERRSCTEVTDTECTTDLECQEQFGADWTFDDTNSAEPCLDPAPEIAVFYKADKYGEDLQTFTSVRFGDRYPDASVSYYEYPNPLGMSSDDIQAAFGNVSASAVTGGSKDADIALFIGTSEAVVLANVFINTLSNAGEDPTTRTYLFSHGAAADSPNLLQNFGAPEDYIDRIEAVAPNIFNTTAGLYEPWQLRYSSIFNEPAQTSVGGIAYDSALVHLFAMDAAASDGEITAERISQVFQSGRLQDGSATRILFKDPTFPGNGQQELGRGNNIDLVGVSGDLNFVFNEGDNQGIVRSNYLGLSVQSRTTPQGDTVYEGVPTRLYLLRPGEVFGDWTNL